MCVANGATPMSHLPEAGEAFFKSAKFKLPRGEGDK